MKKFLVLFLMSVLFTGCVATSPSGSGPEAQAKTLTTQMKNELDLNKFQEDKVLSLNVTYQAFLKRNDKLEQQQSRESYLRSLKEILTSDQYSKLLVSFPDL